MFAVLKTGGKQYRVQEGDKLTIGRIEGDVGSTITLNTVMAIDSGAGLTLGAPFVNGASVTANVVAQNKANTVIIFKKKRRQNYRRRNGHRQEQTILEIKSIASN